jgi:hypothetical protein
MQARIMSPLTTKSMNVKLYLLSPHCGASSGCRSGRWPPDVGGNSFLNKQSWTSCRGVVLKLYGRTGVHNALYVTKR